MANKEDPMLSGQDMTLKEYFLLKGLSISTFAYTMDYSRNHLSATLNGTLKPGKKLLRMIERVTQGEVKPNNAFADVKTK